MDSYSHVISDAEPVMSLVLRHKTGRIPKGTYGFLEYYCTDTCDCRRVTIVVVNEKMKQKAVIGFGFDQEGPFAGPYLDTSSRQSPYAHDLLQLFVDSLNSSPDWLERLYRHYVAVREKIEGKPYRSEPFPPTGKLVYHVMPPPDLAAEIEQSLRNLQASGRGAGPAKAGESAAKARKQAQAPPPPKGAETISSLVTRYADLRDFGPARDLLQLQDDLRRYLLTHLSAGDEIGALLPALYQQSPQPDEQIQGALRLLYDALDVLDQEVEDGTPDAKRRMEGLQKGLAQHIFAENEDPDLCAAAANILIQSRVDILPVLRESTANMIVTCAPRSDLHDLPAEDVMAGISRSFLSMGVSSPFEGVQELQQLLTLNDAEVQIALTVDMLEADDILLREIAALMLFDPDPEVSVGVSNALGAMAGGYITPETLRRLILSRNWFREEIRKHVDHAITNARKSRVECAPLPKLPPATVYASPIDGEGEQTFQVTVPDGNGFARCSIVLRQGEGITQCFVLPLKTKYELDSFVKALNKDPSFAESSAEHLDLRVCNALADGLRAGHVPNQWLVRVAELLGRDRWRGISFDSARELLSLQEELASHDPKLLDEREYRDAVELSGELLNTVPFLSSWYEADDDVEREIEMSRGKRVHFDSAAAAERIVDAVLEKRRAVWLERLVVTALWLKSSTKPPMKWHRIYHVAQAVADESIPLKEIPMMVSIAKATVNAYRSSTAIVRKGPSK